MYQNLRVLLNVADTIGDVDDVRMDNNWLPGKDHITISGTTKEGDKFSLDLEIVRKEVSDDRN